MSEGNVLLGCGRLHGQGGRRLCSFYVSGGRLLAWFHCVGNSFDFSSGPRCIVCCCCCCFFDLDDISIMMMIVATLLGAAHSYPETSLWIFFFLEERYAFR